MYSKYTLYVGCSWFFNGWWCLLILGLQWPQICFSSFQTVFAGRNGLTYRSLHVAFAYRLHCKSLTVLECILLPVCSLLFVLSSHLFVMVWFALMHTFAEGEKDQPENRDWFIGSLFTASKCDCWLELRWSPRHAGKTSDVLTWRLTAGITTPPWFYCHTMVRFSPPNSPTEKAQSAPPTVQGSLSGGCERANHVKDGIGKKTKWW